MAYKNKEDQKACRKRWYENHKEIEIERTRKRRLKQKTWLLKLKKKLSCKRCGFKNPHCLHFHHPKESVKKGDISSMVHKGYSIENILKEISKCEVLCANCHLIEHSKEKVVF
ncbi:hypothetical protein LCGC14_1768470 [marine sediment metagenome]|uniref:HNH domain-containing protein n=1 Tax=marine sediment metagenome TaxID=412755 RepID=A0A0F9JDW3_9ZZZZ